MQEDIEEQTIIEGIVQMTKSIAAVTLALSVSSTSYASDTYVIRSALDGRCMQAGLIGKLVGLGSCSNNAARFVLESLSCGIYSCTGQIKSYGSLYRCISPGSGTDVITTYCMAKSAQQIWTIRIPRKSPGGIYTAVYGPGWRAGAAGSAVRLVNTGFEESSRKWFFVKDLSWTR